MTIRKMADIFTALGRKVHFSHERAEEYRNYASRVSWTGPQSDIVVVYGLYQGNEIKCPVNLPAGLAL